MIITDLKQAPQHFDTVADRIWRAWWEADGDPISDLVEGLREVGAADGFPCTFVASDNDRFLGTVTAIQSDISDRPHLGPCVAALWVEPDARGQGIAQSLIGKVLALYVSLGFKEAYLSARPHLHDFYALRGWTLVESDVGRDHLYIFRRALP
jgi:predicted N-acetyltransferase YhbS